MVTLHNWSWIVNMGGMGRSDYLTLYGEFENHPSIQGYACPSSFVEFDSNTLIGKGYSGRTYQLDKDTFIPNGNARTIEDAIKMIEDRIKARNSQ